jgi:allantoate deiminase
VSDAARLQKRVDDLAKIGGSGTSVTRLGLTDLEREGHDLIASWCAPYALPHHDEAGNLYLRFAGADPDAPVLLVGSHGDSVPEGGRFDGALGVCMSVEAVVSLVESGARFARPVEVVAWADEEGARFGVGLFGSCAAFGRLPPGAPDLRDRDGTSIVDALRALGHKGDPIAARRDLSGIHAYLEPHIEQGPRLERAGLALGVVSDIVGIYHARVRVKGRADHAGATVMGARKDALVAATQIIAAVERIASRVPDTVGTVGEISVRPGAKNVVPGECVFSLDMRAPKQDALELAKRELTTEMSRVTRERGVEFHMEPLHAVPVTPLDQRIRETLVKAVRSVGVEPPLMVSGAGHDAQNPSLSGVPTGMIFVRSTGGSHTPTEFAATADAALGARALELAIRELAS